MKLYTETTDGSNIETKETALVWHHQEADPDFGSCQAKELLDHLENVVANEPAVVKRGQHIVEVKPQVNMSFLLPPQTYHSVSCRICFSSVWYDRANIEEDPLTHISWLVCFLFIYFFHGELCHAGSDEGFRDQKGSHKDG